MPAKQMCSQAKLFFGQRPATALGSVLLLAFVAAGAVTAWAEWWAPLRALDRARKAVHLEQWQRAQVHLDQVLSRNPDCMEARLFAARVATARQDYLKALEWVREIPDGDAQG